MNRIIRYTVHAGDLPVTLGQYLRRRHFSATVLTAIRHERDAAARVNGDFRRLIDPLAAGDEIVLTLPYGRAVLFPNPTLNVTLRYEDDDLLVLEKPDDMLVHPAGCGFDDALGNFVAAHWPDMAFRPVGRLDRHTTGLVVTAKTRQAAAALTGCIHKEYLALAEGVLDRDTGTIRAPLVRIPGSIIMRRVAAEGQPCVTHFRVEQRFPRYTLVRLWLETGRTHQIRVHLASLGCPLAGDTLYGGHTELIDRCALHCAEIRFEQPVTNEPLHFISPLPDDFQQALRRAR